MYALVENGSIVKHLNGNKGLTIGEYQYSRDIFTKWTNEERLAIGVYPVRIDTTNKKDEAYYINTDITYAVSGNEVVGSYGTPTAKPLNNILFVEGDEIPSDKAIGDIKQYGLKGLEIAKIKAQAGGLLAPTDWHIVKEVETSDYVVPTAITEYRTQVRAKSNEMESQINACGTVEDLKTLFTWTQDENGNITRPLVSFPEVI